MDRSTPENARSSIPQMVNGTQSDSIDDAPASSIPDAARQQQRQVLISRNTGSGYERPERARTSHACEPCRERKTKCDGERPSCRRCLHTNTPCHYGYGKGWKKRKTAEDLTVTSRKLARYEELLNDIFPLVTDNVRSMIEQARQQDYGPLEGSDAADSITSNSSSTFDIKMKSGSPTSSRLPLPVPVPLTHSSSSFAGTHRSLPPSIPFDTSLSPTRSKSSSENPALDEPSTYPTLRLPSITRHGFLVEDASRGQHIQGPGATVPEVKRGMELSGEEDVQGDRPRTPQPG